MVRNQDEFDHMMHGRLSYKRYSAAYVSIITLSFNIAKMLL